MAVLAGMGHSEGRELFMKNVEWSVEHERSYVGSGAIKDGFGERSCWTSTFVVDLKL